MDDEVSRRLAETEKLLREMDGLLGGPALVYGAPRRDRGTLDDLVSTVAAPLRDRKKLLPSVAEQLTDELAGGNEVHRAVVRAFEVGNTSPLHDALYTDVTQDRATMNQGKVAMELLHKHNSFGHTALDATRLGKKYASNVGDARAERLADRMIETLERYKPVSERSKVNTQWTRSRGRVT